MLKKLLVLMLVFVGAITLVGCDNEPEGLTDAQKLEAALADVDIVLEVSGDITLDTEGLNGATIVWESANTDLIANDGTVTQPSVTEGDQLVLVKALITIGDLTAPKEFTVKVLATTELNDVEKLAAALPELALPTIVADDMVLPTTGLHGVTISWASSNEMYIAADGTVTNPLKTDGNMTVTLTATFTSGSETDSVDFDVEVSANEELTDLEILNNAKGVILLTASGNVEANFELPAQAAGIDIAWTSANTDLVTIDGTTAMVTRPASDAGNQEVTLTATLTQNDVTVTKDFVVTIKAEDPANVYASIAAMHESAIIDEVIEFTGVVVGTFSGGYFLSDGTHSLGIYNPGSTLENIAIGDEIKLKGSYAVYNTLYQLGSVTSEERLQTGVANPLTGTETVVSVSELLAVDSSDALIHGMYYTVTGTVDLQGTYDNVYLVDGDDQVLVYYYSNDDSIAALEAQVGKEVTITVLYYTDHGTNGPMMAYDGGEAGITVNTLPDADALAADVAALSTIPGVTLTDIVLPTVGPNGTMFSAWVSSNTDRIANDGTFGTVGTESTLVTFTSTATIGDLSQDVTVEVLVPVNSTVGEVLAMDKDAYFQVTGTIFDISYYGLFIEQGGDYIFVYTKEYAGPAVVGDEIMMLGARDEYSGLAQVALMSDITIVSSGNAVPTAVATTIGAVQNDLVPRGTIATITGTVSIEGTYDNVYLTDSAGSKVVVYYRSNASELEGFVGQRITVDVISYQNATVLYKGVAADATVAAAVTDAEKVAEALDAIELMDMQMVELDVTLPTTNANNGVTFVWVSSDAAVIATDGTVTRVPGANTNVTLTVTATSGAETADLNITLVVLDANDMDAMSVSDALLETDGANLLVEGIVSGIYSSYGDTEVVIQDLVTGESIYVDFDVTDAMVGDHVIVRGDLETYTSYGNNKRQLDSGNLISIESSGNAVMVNAETDVAVIADAFAMMHTYTTTLTVKSFDSYGYVFFTGSETRDLTFSVNTYAPYFEDVYMVGDTLLVTFTVMDINYDNTRVVNVMLPALDEAQNMLAAKGALEVPATVVEDLTPVLAFADYNATITWASDTEAVIAVDGTVVRPAIGEADATVVLTATITVGATTETMDFTVTVPAIPTPSTMGLFFSQYGDGDGGSCKFVELYNPTGDAIDLSEYTIVKGGNGTAFADSSDIQALTGTLAAGAVIVVGNPACFNGSDAGSLDAGFPQTGIDYITSTVVGYINGDDALGLFHNGTLIDVIGLNGEDPGSSWPVGNGNTTDGNTANVGLIRIPSIEMGETDWTVGATQWIVIDDRDYSDVGTHTVD